MTGMDVGDEVLDELYRLAYRAALRIVRDSGDAQDCAQEAVARAVLRWRRVSAFAEPWVVKVSTNLAIGVVRKQTRVTLISEPPDEQAMDSDEELVAASLDLRSALIRLPVRQREALVMRYVAGVAEV